MNTATLHRLLDEELAYSPSYLGRYSNHAAMALVALHQMGASDERLEAELARHVAGESEPRDDSDTLAEQVEEVRRDGIATVVRKRVPALVTGPGSQLFHPMIRLAYALGVGHEGQVAAALLDWETRFQAAAPVGADVLCPEADIDSISTFALAAHATADEFITLHMVTGARALRVVGEWVEPFTAQELVAYGAWALAGAYQGVGAPDLLQPGDLDVLRAVPAPSRDEVAERAVAATDPHHIKLADVALTEELRSGDPLYRYVAAKVVGLVPSA